EQQRALALHLDRVASRGIHLEREQAPSALEVLPRGGQPAGAGVDGPAPERLGGTAADRNERRRHRGQRHRTPRVAPVVLSLPPAVSCATSGTLLPRPPYGWTRTAAVSSNCRRVSAGTFRCSSSDAATTVPVIPPTTAPMAAPFPPLAIAPAIAPTP